MSFNAGEIYYDIGIKDREYARALKRMEQDADRVTGNIAGKFTKMAAAIGAGAMFVKAMGNARAFSRELANVQSIADDLDMSKVREERLRHSPMRCISHIPPVCAERKKNSWHLPDRSRNSRRQSARTSHPSWTL